MLLAWDTETSGLPIWKEPSTHPDQPFVVSIALLALDPKTLVERTVYSAILKPPEGRTIPDELMKIHGISTERALDEGLEREDAIRLYASMRKLCAGSVAHNAPFDIRMMRIELLRYGFTKDEIEAIEASSPQHCTQRLATPVLNLPPTGRMKAAGFGGKPKSASLADCLRLMFGKEDAEAHGALADARACADVFRWLKERGHV